MILLIRFLIADPIEIIRDCSYSLLKLLTGLATAALTDLYPTAIQAIIIDANTASRNTSGVIFMRNTKFCSQLLIIKYATGIATRKPMRIRMINSFENR